MTIAFPQCRLPRRTATAAILAVAAAVSQPARTDAQTPWSLETSRAGEHGPQLLLIPCMSCRWRSFDTFMERNRERYRMVAVTLPGFGGTAVPPLARNTTAPVWHRFAIDQLEQVIDREHLDSVFIVAHSFGADMAVELAARRPAEVRGLILLDSYPFSDRSWFREDSTARVAQADSTAARQTARLSDPDEWQRFNTPGIPDAGRRLLYHGWFMATPLDVVLQYWRENSLVDLNLLWPRIGIPVLDVKSIPASSTDPARDREHRIEQLRANHVPATVRTVFLDSAGHFAHETRPHVIDSLVAHFIDGSRHDREKRRHDMR